jgi:hypothetical protein
MRGLLEASRNASPTTKLGLAWLEGQAEVGEDLVTMRQAVAERHAD